MATNMFPSSAVQSSSEVLASMKKALLMNVVEYGGLIAPLVEVVSI